MNIQSVITHIDRYLASDKSSPIFVDVPDVDSMRELVDYYNVGENTIVYGNQFCESDGLPVVDLMLDRLSNVAGIKFLTCISTFLQLQGAQEFKRIVRLLMGLQIIGKLVIFTKGSSDYYGISDQRLFDNGTVYFVSGDSHSKPYLPKVRFISHELSSQFENCQLGISLLGKAMELTEWSEINIVTTHGKSEFKNALINIIDHKSPFGQLIEEYPDLALDESWGNDALWRGLLKAINDEGDWSRWVDAQFGGAANLRERVKDLPTLSTEMRWMLFIALKVHGGGKNGYLSDISAMATDVDNLVKLMFLHLLDYSTSSKEFYQRKAERYELLKSFNESPSDMASFCQQTEGYGLDGIKYLSDLTRQEKEQIITLIAKHGSRASDAELVELLGNAYPALATYLLPYDYGSGWIDNYFKSYRFNKVRNAISPDFIELVEKQAKEREYNKILPRMHYLSKVHLTKTEAFFVDALGVEYLPYIQHLCAKHGLVAHADIARCELPSITSQNKDFNELFAENGVSLTSIKDLDELKHGDNIKYNYTRTTLPIHIARELEVLDNIIIRVVETLSLPNVKQVVIVSDHGASRLAVIHEKENKWALSDTKGEHSGRCCPKSVIDETPDVAADENGFWCLANYDRFKGGRKASVEVHGGASLEEVLVPVITIRQRNISITAHIMDAYKRISVSFKKKAKIIIYVSEASDNLKVRLNGKFYPCQPTDMDYHYEVEFDDIKRAGDYTCDLTDDNNLIKEGLSFTVKKEGASERKLF